jgi:glycosylphosphatidylinositol transamidase
MVLYDHVGPGDGPSSDMNPLVLPSWIPESLSGRDDVKDYTQRLRSIARHVGYQATGQGSGVHGLFHQSASRKHAIALSESISDTAWTPLPSSLCPRTALMASTPSAGAGQRISSSRFINRSARILESSLRTANNLLERLHASFFFYIMTGPGRFMKIGSYLPSVILVSVSMMFGGFGEYVSSGWTQVRSGDKLEWQRRVRPVLTALGIMAHTHFAGWTALILLRSLAPTDYLVVRAPSCARVSEGSRRRRRASCG